MNQAHSSYARPAVAAPVDARARFITRTYNHLFGAIVLFAATEYVLFATGVAETIARFAFGTSWLVIIGAFMIGSWVASRAAHTAESIVAQYAALVGFVFLEALVFVPLLFIAQNYAPGAIQSAGLLTMLGFAGLTAIAFITKKDFAFLRGFLLWGGVVAMLAIVGGAIFGFQLGTFFSVAMVGFAGVAILYDTSNVLHHFPEDRYVAGALELFASVALMFWYILRIFIASRD